MCEAIEVGDLGRESAADGACIYAFLTVECNPSSNSAKIFDTYH